MTPSTNATIYDVARAAGVSITTVSNALNRPGRVGKDTRARVLRIADELGYTPKSQAVILARKGMRRIGVLAPFTSYPSFFERLKGVLQEATLAGVEVSVFDYESAATASSPVLASMPIRGQIDGLLVMGQRIEPTVEARLFARSVPTVVVDADSDSFSTVGCDDYAGGSLAADYLVTLGHRKIAYVVERQVTDYESQAVRRLRGFQSRCAQSPDCALEIVESELGAGVVRSRATELLGRDDRPTAVMCHYDDMAVSVLKAAKDIGLRVPQDVSVMGYDDGPAAEATDLDTIAQPFRESGGVAARLLLAEIASPGQPRITSTLDLRLVARGSSAAPL